MYFCENCGTTITDEQYEKGMEDVNNPLDCRTCGFSTWIYEDWTEYEQAGEED